MAVYFRFTIDEGPLTALAAFIPAIAKLLPEFSGFNKQLYGMMINYKFIRETFKEPSTRTPGAPQNFQEAFIDEMERIGDNPHSSFHPSRKPKMSDIFKLSET